MRTAVLLIPIPVDTTIARVADLAVLQHSALWPLKRRRSPSA